MTTAIPDDLVQPFQIEPFALRGRLVRLGMAIDTILTQHDYPEPVAIMLGEAIALAGALAGALKYEGVFTLQTKGDGPIRMMVADVTTAGAIRGYAQIDQAKLDAMTGASAAVPRLLGAGYLALTVDQGEHTERYQGIVELQGGTLAECVHHYFHQSEQVEAALKVAVAKTPGADGQMRWRAGALMIQRLPSETFTLEREEEDEGWRRATILMASSTSAELIDPSLPADQLLFRLFHEDGVRAHPAHHLAAQCRCSRERVESVLHSLPADDLEEMKVDGLVTVTCEFCSKVYAFSDDDLAALKAG